MGYLSRCGPVDCISKVTNLQGTFCERSGVTLPVPFISHPKRSSIKKPEAKTSLPTTINAEAPEVAPLLFRKNPELPGSSEALG